MTRIISGLLSATVWIVWFAARCAKYPIDGFIGLMYSLALSLQDALRQSMDTSK